jgi:hypothetical protein
MGLRLGFHSCPSTDEVTYGLSDTIRMISWVGPFLKPCAFGAPQAALGLDQRPYPAVRVCRVINAALLILSILAGVALALVKSAGLFIVAAFTN